MIDQHVSQAFAALGIEPRPLQAETCETVIGRFMAGKPIVVVDAPTGSGKSVISMVVARAMRTMQGTGSVVVSSTNSLVRQYERDFCPADQDARITVIGADRYPCELRTRISKVRATAAHCYRRSPFFEQRFAGSSIAQLCDGCEFRRSRDLKPSADTVVTNYAYFFIDRMFMSAGEDRDENDPTTFDGRDLFVFDEAHLFSETFASHCAIHFSKNRADEFLEDCRKVAGNEEMADRFAKAFDILFENVGRSTIGPSNVGKFLGTLLRFYQGMYSALDARSRGAGTEAEHDAIYRYLDKYRRLLCKVEDYFRFEYDVAVDCREESLELTVKPIFPFATFRTLRAKYNLFLSATVDPAQLAESLSVPIDEVAHVRVPYSFGRTDKTIVIPRDLPKLNYRTMADPTVLSRLGSMGSEILRRHPNERGIVVVTSFSLAKAIAQRLRSNHEIILHESGESVEPLVELLKQTTSPTVLISPSLFEGVDLPGDSSRFQIIAKTPYLSLGDKRISAIMHRYPGAYETMTIMRLVQALGRSTRFSGDHCRSYFLDATLERTFMSDRNLWKSQFTVERA